MSSLELLDKTRRIGRLLHEPNGSGKLVFNDVCRLMSDALSSNVLVISKKGKLLGAGEQPQVTRIGGMLPHGVGKRVDRRLNERLLSILSTNEQVNLETLGFEGDDLRGYSVIVTPIQTGGDRLGTIFIYKSDEHYEIEDIILCEYAASVVGLEMLRAKSEEDAEEERKHSLMDSAIKTLSISEMEAMACVFDALEGEEGILVASRVAERVGITRSVIVSALRKFESAGVIETHSLGMKGTYIKVLNDVAFEETDRLREASKS